jgi:acyl-CoA synthetase (AMP-forming)/AMP-acid ligase II
MRRSSPVVYRFHDQQLFLAPTIRVRRLLSDADAAQSPKARKLQSSRFATVSASYRRFRNRRPHKVSGRRLPSFESRSARPRTSNDSQFGGGENISSVEVEGALLRHPAVQEVAIVGMPDERWGEAPHAFVVLKAGATATETELRNYARDHLAHFKCPQRIQFVSELPKTATGKVQKYVLRGKPAISKQ